MPADAHGYDICGPRVTLLRDLRAVDLAELAEAVNLPAFQLRRLETAPWSWVRSEVAHGMALRLGCEVGTMQVDVEDIDDGARWCSLDVKLPAVRCVACRRDADALCDHPEDGGTCDAPVCDVHAQQVGPDAHRCPEHSDNAAEAAYGGT